MNNSELRKEFANFCKAQSGKLYAYYNQLMSTNLHIFGNACAKYFPTCSRKSAKQVPYVLRTGAQVVAIGDLHGDYCAALDCLKLAGIIDHKVDENTSLRRIKWLKSASEIVVVQTGDIVDSKRSVKFPKAKEICQSYLKIVSLFDYLNQYNACVNGKRGRIYKLFGNHEMMNLEGDTRYVSKSEHTEMEQKFLGNRLETFGAGGTYAKQLGCTTTGAMMIVNDTLYMHGGLSKQFVQTISKGLNEKLPLKYITILVNDILRKYAIFGINKLDENEKKIYDMIMHSTGPMWYRGIGKKNKTKTCNIVENVLDSDIRNIVIGHTVQPTFVTGTSCKNKQVFRIDVAMSYSFGLRQHEKTFSQILIFTDNATVVKYKRGNVIKMRKWNGKTGTWTSYAD